MIAIYRDEDTDFAGAEPIQIKINTPLDLTGYTAKILFGSVVKDYGAEEVGTKTLGLSFTAAESASFFPGRGFASVKVFDTEGRVAILKRFVIDVRFRSEDSAPISFTDVSEMLNCFENVKSAAEKITRLTDNSDLTDIRSVINELIEAAKKRNEFSIVPPCELAGLPASTVVTFMECMRQLEGLAKDAEELGGDADEAQIREVLNGILATFGGGLAPRIDLQDPENSVLSLVNWAKQCNKALRTINV